MNNPKLDLLYLDRALSLAGRGEGQVGINPLVGALVVNYGYVVGQGFHRYADIKHAEVLALEQAGSLSIGGTLYVNLEPCAYCGEGKHNSPCIEALIAAKVKRVVCCMRDPNPKLAGKGLAAIREAGIEVLVGL